MYKIEYDPSGNSNSSFQVGAKTLNLLLLYANLMFFHTQSILRLANAMFLLGSLRLSLPANVNLNCDLHLPYYYQCSQRLFPFLNSVD